MEEFFPIELIDLLVISITTSIVTMAVIQKFKTLALVKKDWHVWILNLILSFSIGIPFAMFFYDLTAIQGIWVSVFTFVGAPALYDALKNQNIVNYKPASLEEKVKEIKRD